MRILIGTAKGTLLFGSLGSAMLLSYIGHHDQWVRPRKIEGVN